MKLRKFCSKCGKEFKNESEIHKDFLCEACSGAILPDITFPVLTLNRCKLCGAYSLKKDTQEFPWEFKHPEEQDIDFITRILFEKVLFKFEKKYLSEFKLYFDQKLNLVQDQEIKLVIERISQPQKSEHKIQQTVRIHQSTCINCGKKIGGRFDAILQIRIFNDDNLTRLDKIIEKAKKIVTEMQLQDAKNFISALEKTKNGFDLKLSSTIILTLLTFKLRRSFPFIMKHSKKLMGVDHNTGGELYRHTILLKLIPVRKGDMIQMENIQYVVNRIEKNKVFLMNRITFNEHGFSFTVFEKKKYQKIERI